MSLTGLSVPNSYRADDPHMLCWWWTHVVRMANTKCVED